MTVEPIYIATTPLYTSVQVLELKSGRWRAYLRDFVTPFSPRGQQAMSKEVVRDNYGYIVSADTKEQLIDLLQKEYPHWQWHTKALAKAEGRA